MCFEGGLEGGCQRERTHGETVTTVHGERGKGRAESEDNMWVVVCAGCAKSLARGKSLLGGEWLALPLQSDDGIAQMRPSSMSCAGRFVVQYP